MPKSDSNVLMRDKHPAVPAHVGFLLVEDFAMLPYAAVIEALRAANRLSGRALYRWSHISIDGAPTAASNGVRIACDAQVGVETAFDWVVVCAGGNPAIFAHAPTFRWLRRLARRKIRLGGVSGGPYILARAGVLAGYRATVHWEHAAAFAEEFPDHDLRRSLYEIDRDRLTAGGGTAPLDMMHALLADEHGPDLAHAVSAWFLQTQIREGANPQRLPLRQRLGVASPPLLRAVARMEAATEEPLSPDALAAAARVSRRQIERLFRRHLGRSMGAYYLALRLDRARDLLRQSSLTVVETGLACGFASASHFSRAYRRRFGHPPREERRRRV